MPGKGSSMILNYVRHKSLRRPWVERYTEDGARVEDDFDDNKSGPAGEKGAEDTSQFNEKKALEAGKKNPAFDNDTTEF